MMLARRLQYWLYELFAFYAIFVGVTSYCYDFKRRLYKNTKWTQLVASFSNLILVSVTILDLAWVWIYYENVNRVTRQIFQLDFSVNDIVCLLRLLQRIPRERATRNIEQELQRLIRFHRYHCVRNYNLNKQDIRRLRCIYLVKNFLMWLSTGIVLLFSIIAYQLMNLMQGNVYLMYTLLVLKILAFDTQNITTHIHFLLSLRICRFYMRLNSRMRELIKRNSPENAMELNHLRRLHMKLTSLMDRLTATYDIVMITTRLSLIITSATTGYYISISECFPSIYAILGCVFYALLALHGYILDLIVDWTVNEHQKTLTLLRQHYELDQPDTQLSRGCDMFALELTNFPMQIKPCGMFTCSTATWFSNIACIISWMVVILQYRIESEQN